MATLGDWVAARRKILKMDRQQDLAHATGLGLTTISVIERGLADLRRMEPATKKILAIKLRVSEEDFQRLIDGEIFDAPVVGAGIANIEAEISRTLGVDATAWLEGFPRWFARQSPEFRAFIINSVLEQRTVAPAPTAVPHPQAETPAQIQARRIASGYAALDSSKKRLKEDQQQQKQRKAGA